MKAKIARDLLLLAEHGDRLGMPLSRPIVGYKFRELRVQMGGNAARVFHFATSGRRIILLHAFLKKSNKTSPRELQIAASRYAEYLRR
jgi:phage-related protein